MTIKTFTIQESAIDDLEDPNLKAFTGSSSFVGNVRYDSANQSLKVKLNGKTYNFCDVPERVYDAFEGSTSKGKYFNNSIKTQFNCGGITELQLDGNYEDWPPKLTGGMDQVDCLMLNYSPGTVPPDGYGNGDPPQNDSVYPSEPYTYPETLETSSRCANCRFFQEGGACAIVKGPIEPDAICKFYEPGIPLPLATQIFPVYEKPEATYKPAELEPKLNEPYYATANKTGSQPPTLGIPGHSITNPSVLNYQNENPNPDSLIFGDLIPTEVRETSKRMARFIYTQHLHDKLCKICANQLFDLNSEAFRPIPPTEDQDDFNTDESCRCYYIEIKPVDRDTPLETEEEKEEITDTEKIEETRKIIRETISELSTQFNWMTPDYLDRIRNLSPNIGGRFVLVRASAEAITDHRGEGEPYRRLLKGEELAQLTRTGIRKTTDINHYAYAGQPNNPDGNDYRVDSDVVDAEYDPIRKESQMLVHLRDPEIINFIETGKIESVSINAGAPRHMHTECDTGECFVVPRGLMLGELDNIAFTWVVTNPSGIVWKGIPIRRAEPGVKTTAIELL